MKLYSIYDRGSESYNQLFQQPTDAAAIRIIKNEMAQGDSMLAKHATDFELWRLAEFNQETGAITESKERVVRCEALLVKGDAA